MRLVCPNCEAKYEVPEDAIPETGRDVQCANCGHAWFQMRRPTAAAAPVAAPSPAPVREPAPEPVPEPPSIQQATSEPVPEVVQEVVPEAPAETGVAAGNETEPEPEPASAPAVASGPIVEADASAVEAAADPEPAVMDEIVPDAPPESEPASATVPEVTAEDTLGTKVPADTTSTVADSAEDDQAEANAGVPLAAGATAYAVDDSVLAILREEAEREAKARQTDGFRPLETQTDLGLEQAMPAASRVPDVIAEDPALAARRARLPDVEEINSTLRPSEIPDDETSREAMAIPAEGRSSFRSGFVMVLALAIIGSGIYASADALAEMVPALAGPLQGYVSFVDSLRLQLDGLMQSATVAINGN